VAQVIFNSLFTIDLWYDAAVGIRLFASQDPNAGWLVACLLFLCITPIDFANLCLRTSHALDQVPRQSHLMNLCMEIPMLGFNIYIVLTCVLLALFRAGTKRPGTGHFGRDCCSTFEKC
jgi:hypothetical protein